MSTILQGWGAWSYGCLNLLKVKESSILITTRKRSLWRLCFYRCVSVHGGGCGRWACMAGRGHAWQGGMHGKGACIVGACMVGGVCMAEEACMAGGAWQGACMAGGMHAEGHMWQGVCMTGGHACWGVCMAEGGMHGRGACVVGGMHGRGDVHGRYYKIQSMSRQYASYWNAFLFKWWIHCKHPSSLSTLFLRAS